MRQLCLFAAACGLPVMAVGAAAVWGGPATAVAVDYPGDPAAVMRPFERPALAGSAGGWAAAVADGRLPGDVTNGTSVAGP